MSIAKRAAILLVYAAASFYCVGCNFVEEINKLTVEDISVSAIRDGSYTGNQNSFPITARVLVTVNDGKITDIKLLKHSHGPKRGADAILKRVIEKQSLRVDAVTGATHSSKVVLKAIESALKQGF